MLYRRGRYDEEVCNKHHRQIKRFNRVSVFNKPT
jgi:hypothetical protein